MRGHGTVMVGEAMPIAAATALGTSLSCFSPLLFLLALHRDKKGSEDVLGAGLTPASSERPDSGERNGLTELEASMGKPFSVLHEYNKNKFPKAPDKPSKSVMWCPVS